MNWFVALNGSVRCVNGTSLGMDVAPAYQAYRAEVGKDALVWIAQSKSVIGIAGFGLSPEAAIRAFEERMRIDG